MRVFSAMLLDSYRELNSKRLFWVILTLSILFVVVYGSIGFNEQGMSMFFGLWDVESDLLTTGSEMSELLYRGIFATFVVPIWLAWIATILALISTASVFPDFVAGGSIDMVLSKPIGRVRLFAYKFFASLLFVLLQVAVFCLGVFLCMGIRIGDWEWRVFLAVPIVIAFFSYLFSVCVFIGVWTRSTLAALLLTLLFWFGLYAVNQTEGILNVFWTRMTMETEDYNEQIKKLQTQPDDLAQGETGDHGEARPRVDDEIRNRSRQRKEIEEKLDKLRVWHRLVRVIQMVLPKTSETIGLLDRYLSREGDINLMELLSGNVQRDASGGYRTVGGDEDSRMMRRVRAEYDSRSHWYVIGTSLIFEMVVLCGACWIFVRRDY